MTHVTHSDLLTHNVKNSDIAATMHSLPNVDDITAKRRLALFGHVMTLEQSRPWVGLTHGLLWVGLGWIGFTQMLHDHHTGSYRVRGVDGIFQSI